MGYRKRIAKSSDARVFKTFLFAAEMASKYPVPSDGSVIFGMMYFDQNTGEFAGYEQRTSDYGDLAHMAALTRKIMFSQNDEICIEKVLDLAYANTTNSALRHDLAALRESVKKWRKRDFVVSLTATQNLIPDMPENAPTSGMDADDAGWTTTRRNDYQMTELIINGYLMHSESSKVEIIETFDEVELAGHLKAAELRMLSSFQYIDRARSLIHKAVSSGDLPKT